MVRIFGAALFAFFLVLSSYIPANAAPGEFVYVQGNKLMLNGQEYFVKGANLLPGFRYHAKYLDAGNVAPNLELLDTFMYWHDFDPVKIEEQLRYYHDVLGVNTVRIMTPSLSYFNANVQYHAWQPWFLPDGSINPVYRDRVVKFLDIAERTGVKVFMELFHNSHFNDWECRGEGQAWKDCTAEELAGVRKASNARYFEPGTAKEAKYYAYLESFLPFIKDHPGLFAYEVGSETLQKWAFNGYGVADRRDWWQDKTGSFIVRMARKIKQLDPNHLISEGEVTSYNPAWTDYWAFPSPEFGVLNDIHALNGGQPYRLVDMLDFLSPHFYNFTMASPDPGLLAMAATTIKQRAPGKPFILGETGYMKTDADLFAIPVSDPVRVAYIKSIVDLRRNPGIGGYLIWSPFPPVDIVPGSSVVSVPSSPWSGGKAFRLPGPPERTITGPEFSTAFTLFAYDENYAGNMMPFPEAEAYFGPISAPNPAPANNASCSAHTIPAAMATNGTTTVSISFRNTGTKTWSPATYNASLSPWPVPSPSMTPTIFAIPSTVAPGGTMTKTFVLTAPAAPGSYAASYQLVEQGVGWFGATCGPATIAVSAPPAPPPPAPVIVSFRATPPSITAGESARLIWSTVSASSCEASGAWNGAKGTAGDEPVSPGATTAYRLTCRNGVGASVAGEVTVTVAVPPPNQPPASVPPPRIIAFRADPASITQGSATRIRWEAAGAASCAAGEGWQGARGTAGSEQVSPASSQSYRLTCRNSAGAEVSARITVAVSAPPVSQPPASQSPTSSSPTPKPPATIPPAGTTVRPTATTPAAPAPSSGEDDLFSLLQRQQFESATTTASADAAPRFKITLPWLVGIGVLVLLGVGMAVFR